MEKRKIWQRIPNRVHTSSGKKRTDYRIRRMDLLSCSDAVQEMDGAKKRFPDEHKSIVSTAVGGRYCGLYAGDAEISGTGSTAYYNGTDRDLSGKGRRGCAWHDGKDAEDGHKDCHG